MVYKYTVELRGGALSGTLICFPDVCCLAVWLGSAYACNSVLLPHFGQQLVKYKLCVIGLVF